MDTTSQDILGRWTGKRFCHSDSFSSTSHIPLARRASKDETATAMTSDRTSPGHPGRCPGPPRAPDHRYTAQGRPQDYWISRQWPSERIDITIVSLASQDSQTATQPFVTTEDDSAGQRAAKLIEKHLNAVARGKRRRHPPSDRPFRPFVLSLGGMMETEAKNPL
jgi:hypothetical protein